MRTFQPFHVLSLACVLFVLNLAGCATSRHSLPSAFNGKNLDGWKVPDSNRFWRVHNGVLVGENDTARKGSMLYTAEEFQDFVLEADVRWSGEIDSGFMFRKPELQLQIGVSRSLKKDMTGSFYTGGKDAYPDAGRAKNAAELIMPGKWNRFKLQAAGDTYTTWINGTKASEYTNAKYGAPGPIGLQIHPGLAMKVEFRNIRIKRL